MSNKVADLYNIIIENVVNETRNDFEESGEDPSVLEMLKNTWKKRLKDMHVTREPLWEKPESSNVMLNVPHQPLDTNLDLTGMSSIQPQGTSINPINPIASATGNPTQGYGFQRADMMSMNMNQPLQRGVPNVAGLQSIHNGQHPMNIQQSKMESKPEPSSDITHLQNQVQVQAQVQAQIQAQAQAHNGRNPIMTNPIGTGQIPPQTNPSGVPNLNQPQLQRSTPQGTAPGQQVQQQHVQQQVQQPLQQQFSEAFNPLDSSNPLQPSQSTQSTQSTQQSRQMNLSPQLQNDINNAMNNPRVPQTDGNADDELNSDLDDSEDELNSGDEDEDNDQTQIMLCLYEKVHKVKTRWKYILKDGVANINGLDFVFSKGTGESEW